MQIKITDTMDKWEMLIVATVSENRLMRLAKIDLQDLFNKFSWCHYRPNDSLNTYIPCKFLTIEELIVHMENEREAKMPKYGTNDFYYRVNRSIDELKRINTILKNAADDTRIIEYPVEYCGYFPTWKIHKQNRYVAV